MKQEHQDAQVVCRYEEGLEKAGIPCAIMEQASITGNRVKNDRLDSQDMAEHALQ